MWEGFVEKTGFDFESRVKKAGVMDGDSVMMEDMSRPVWDEKIVKEND